MQDINWNEAILNSVNNCLKCSNIFENANPKNKKINIDLRYFLKTDINYIQELLDRKRKINFGDDILNYILNPELTEPDVELQFEQCVDPVKVLLRQRNASNLARLKKRAEKQHEQEKSQIKQRRAEIWQKEKIDQRQLLTRHGNVIFLEPLRLEREQIKKDAEKSEQEKQAWDSHVAQVQPYLSEVEQFGEPRHRVESQFWLDLLGHQFYHENIDIFCKLAPRDDSSCHKLSQEICLHESGSNKIAENVTCLQTRAAQQRAEELQQIHRRKDKMWQPTPPNVREILRDRFNNPPQRKMKKVPRPPPRELTDLEKKQMQAKLRHEYEVKQMVKYRLKFYKPGELNDVSNLRIKHTQTLEEDLENKEFRLFYNRFLKRRKKEKLELYKWKNIIYPKARKVGGLKIFPGFTPLQNFISITKDRKF